MIVPVIAPLAASSVNVSVAAASDTNRSAWSVNRPCLTVKEPPRRPGPRAAALAVPPKKHQSGSVLAAVTVGAPAIALPKRIRRASIRFQRAMERRIERPSAR